MVAESVSQGDLHIRNPIHVEVSMGKLCDEKFAPATYRYEPTATFPGPIVNGRPTTVTQYSPQQLDGSPLLPALRDLINKAFGWQHSRFRILAGRDRLRTPTQFMEQLGTDPQTFVYIVQSSDTGDLLATVNAVPYVGTLAHPEDGKDYTFQRIGVLPSDVMVWELHGLATDPDLFRQGLAGFLMNLVDEEVQRRFFDTVKHCKESGKTIPTRLQIVLTTIKECNNDFYVSKGYKLDSETYHPAGHLGSEQGFTIAHMSRMISLKDCE